MNQELFNKYGKHALLEAKEHLETMRLVIENLSISIKNQDELELLYRATFCLRGFFAMFGIPDPIKDYGLDKCLQILAKSETLTINDEKLQLFLKLLDLLEKYLNLMAENAQAETYKNLLLESETTLKQIQSNLGIIES